MGKPQVVGVRPMDDEDDFDDPPPELLDHLSSWRAIGVVAILCIIAWWMGKEGPI